MQNNDIDFLHLGIKTIDLQHQKFFQLLTELNLYNLSKEENNIIADIINELKSYTVYHFDSEKQIMSRIGYPDIEEHLEQHNIFIKKINDFRIAYEYQSVSLSDQALTFLQKWFLVHISEYDAKYVDYIKLKSKPIT